ncbi:CBS domain-containing protein CBSX1, chloroplastic isoform X2 [Salvia hispanica]|uniref:CBS domain-containing protein CBSX1, chloroplastic isoform X2 n=1 Tax=Salvia hispanica TaxID=49212 RepID=UPI002009AB8A|nr:CBS domain-containing protein CBSX1, chloroplastic isoform X2 [Salvia hispanica]
MSSISRLEVLPLFLLPPSPTSSVPPIPSRFLFRPCPKPHIPSVFAVASTFNSNSLPPRNGVYRVGDFMTRKEDLHVVKSTTTVEQVSGTERSQRTDVGMFPEVDSTWRTFKEVQNLLTKTNGQVVGDLMTPAPVVVGESTNLEDAARVLLRTKYRRLPVVDDDGRLLGIITRGNVVRAALQLKRATEKATTTA